MKVNFARLRTLLRDAAREHFTALRRKHPDEQFYAFALYTDDGAMTVEPAANSEEGFERQAEHGGEDEACYYRWGTAEWAYEAGAQGTSFEKVYKALNPPDRCEDDDFGPFCEELHAAMIGALADLDGEGFFGSGKDRERVTLFISISDSEDLERIEDESAKALNPKPVYARFQKRYD